MSHSGKSRGRSSSNQNHLSPDDTLREAVRHHRAGKLGRAEKLYRSILSGHPDHADANHNLGVVMMQNGSPAMGLRYLRSALNACPGNGPYWLDYIEALHQAGQTDVARQVLHDAQARGLCGPETTALAQLLALAATASAAPPMRPLDTAVALHKSGRIAEALAQYRSLMAAYPDHPDLLQLAGTAECQLGREADGIPLLKRSLELAPQQPDAYRNLGNALWELGRHEEAIECHEHTLRLAPADASAHILLGNRLETLGRSAQAQRHIEQALALDPADTDALWNLAHIKLRAGAYQDGWKLYEVRWPRWERKGNRNVQNYGAPRWSGESPLEGKSILLHAEQGIGDTIQFCRYAQLAAAHGACVILAVPPAVTRLVESLPGVTRIITHGDGLPAFDLQCPLMSLPLAFETSLATIPAPIPYLSSSQTLSRIWSQRLGEKTKLRVGLAWSSGSHPGHPELWKDHCSRNVPLRMLEPLDLPGIEFHSLQKGEEGERQLHEVRMSGWAGPGIVDHAQQLHDFADTAALIEQLDLIISVDTAVAHLAGAMGKPVWIMLRFDACWRWLRDRADSPWYPTARLFRQSSLNDWSGVVAELRRALLARLEAG